MSRKRKTIEGWLCYKNENPVGQTFIRLTNDLIKSPKFLGLKPLSQLLYIHMCMAAAGKIDFIFPYEAYKDVCSKGGFAKAETELMQKGFIEKVESGRFTRTPNKYRFSFKWKS